MNPAAHFELEYDGMLYLGRWILSGKDGNDWHPLDSRPDIEPVSSKTEAFRPKKSFMRR